MIALVLIPIGYAIAFVVARSAIRDVIPAFTAARDK